MSPSYAGSVTHTDRSDSATRLALGAQVHERHNAVPEWDTRLYGRLAALPRSCRHRRDLRDRLTKLDVVAKVFPREVRHEVVRDLLARDATARHVCVEDERRCGASVGGEFVVIALAHELTGGPLTKALAAGNAAEADATSH